MKTLITGASSGIGLALGYSINNEDVVATGRRDKPDRISCDYIQADLASGGGGQAIVDQVIDSNLGCVVHCAGLCIRSATENLSEEEIRLLMEVNFISPVLLTRALLPKLRQSQGTLVLISSLAGLIGSPGNSLYSASKFALEGWAEALAYELADVGVRVRVIVPTYAQTQFMSKAKQLDRHSDGPYSEFEKKTRARFDRTLENGLSAEQVAKQIKQVIEDSQKTEVMFERIIIGDSSMVARRNELASQQWFEEFRQSLG